MKHISECKAATLSFNQMPCRLSGYRCTYSEGKDIFGDPCRCGCGKCVKNCECQCNNKRIAADLAHNKCLRREADKKSKEGQGSLGFHMELEGEPDRD